MSAPSYRVWTGALLAAVALHGLAFLLLPEREPVTQAGTGNTPVRIELRTAPSEPPSNAKSESLPDLEEKPTRVDQSAADDTAQAPAEPQKKRAHQQRAETPPAPEVPTDPAPQATDASPTGRSASDRPDSEAAPPSPPPDTAGAPDQQVGDKTARREYLERLRERLAAHRRYPRRARVRGTEGRAVLTLQFDDAGRIASVRITTATGHETLDGAIDAMLERARPLPDAPTGARLGGSRIKIPVRFALGRRD